MELEFNVQVTADNGDECFVTVTETVSDEEFELLMQCYLDDEDLDAFDGLEDLYERICSAARDECVGMEDCDDEDACFDDAECDVTMPDEVIEEADERDAASFPDLLDNHRCDRFAVETLDWEILNFDTALQQEAVARLLERHGKTPADAVHALSHPADGDAALVQKLTSLGVSHLQGGLVAHDLSGMRSYDLNDLLAELGWEVEFEGESGKFETAGVYFIP
jgi:hypothetical protein